MKNGILALALVFTATASSTAVNAQEAAKPALVQPQLAELTQAMDVKFRSVVVKARANYQKECLTADSQTQITSEGNFIRLLCKKRGSANHEVVYSFERSETGAIELSPGVYRLEVEKSISPTALRTLADLNDQDQFEDQNGHKISGKVLRELMYDVAKNGMGVFFAVELSDQVYPVQYSHDKRKHAAVGSLIGGFTAGLLNLHLENRGKLTPVARIFTALSGMAFGFVVGFAKEVRDSYQPHNRFDKDDVKMTTYGAMVGSSTVSVPVDPIVQAIRSLFHKKGH